MVEDCLNPLVSFFQSTLCITKVDTVGFSFSFHCEQWFTLISIPLCDYTMVCFPILLPVNIQNIWPWTFIACVFVHMCHSLLDCVRNWKWVDRAPGMQTLSFPWHCQTVFYLQSELSHFTTPLSVFDMTRRVFHPDKWVYVVWCTQQPLYGVVTQNKAPDCLQDPSPPLSNRGFGKLPLSASIHSSVKWEWWSL